MVDVKGLAETVTADDFSFKVAGAGPDSGDPSWFAAPAPLAVVTRRGAGRLGSDRVAITWPDGAIRNE